MTELDLEIPGLATDLIAEYGKVIGFGRMTPGDYDPSTGTSTPGGVSGTVKAVVEPYRGQRLLAGLVEAGDLKLTIAAESFPDGEPTTEDVAEIDDVLYTVVNVMPTYSGELVALYEIQIRR